MVRNCRSLSIVSGWQAMRVVANGPISVAPGAKGERSSIIREAPAEASSGWGELRNSKTSYCYAQTIVPRPCKHRHAGREQTGGFPCHPSARSLLVAIRSSLHLLNALGFGTVCKDESLRGSVHAT